MELAIYIEWKVSKPWDFGGIGQLSNVYKGPDSFPVANDAGKWGLGMLDATGEKPLPEESLLLIVIDMHGHPSWAYTFM